MRTTCNNLWILTEERPKPSVLRMIFKYFAEDHSCGFFGHDIKIIPLLDSSKKFSFVYEVIGFKCAKVDRVYIATVSGESSFVDYLVFYQNHKPTTSDIPLYAIEETKTDDSESRNTGVYQRCSKFAYIKHYYPTTKLIMLYALKVEQHLRPTDTYVFGTRLLLTIGVVILGKNLDCKVFKPFNSVDELVEAKNKMALPKSKKNVPILISKSESCICITGRLFKSDGLNHDPNIGAISAIAASLRILQWQGRMVVERHGLEQNHIKKKNKFIRIANLLNIEICGLIVPQAEFPKMYWHYDRRGEKLATIFMHILVENFTNGFSVFENHAGCEKSYFQTSTGEFLPLMKYENRDEYKAGDRSKIVHIPDLVLIDIDNTEAITIEGKKYENIHKGISELADYDAFECLYLTKYYPLYKVLRTVVLYGSNDTQINNLHVGFMLNAEGRLVLGVAAPRLFIQAVNNLLNYWN